MKTDADKLCSFLEQTTSIIETYGNKSIVTEINKAIVETEKSATILFCGEFKRGKSSLVNAIVGNGLCATDIGIATSVVTIIKYGKDKKAVRYYGNLQGCEDSLKLEEIKWDEIEKYTMGDVIEIDNTILVELSYPSPFLKNGINIIDTPGIGGLDPRHAILTQMALPKADVIVFVTDTGEPLTESEKKFYVDYVLPCQKPNLVVVNKSDLLSGDTLHGHLNKLKLEFADIGTPQIIPVSAKHWELYTQLQEDDLSLSSNKYSVLAGITSEIEKYKRYQYKKYRDMVIAEMKDVLETISIEIQQLKKNTNDKLSLIEDLQRQQVALSEFRGDLNNPTSQTRLQINAIFEDARNEVMNLISHEGTLLTSTEFDALLENELVLENDGKWFVAQINNRLQTISRQVDDMIECAFEKISESIGREITSIVDNEYRIISGELKGGNKEITQVISSITGKFMQGGLLGSLTGGFVGGIAVAAAPALALPLGVIVGFATVVSFMWKGLKAESKAAKKINLKQQVLPKVNLAITDVRNQANTRFSKFYQNLLITLQTVIKETEDRMKALQISIQESRENEHQGKIKIIELEQKAKFCETIISQMELLYSNPFANAQ